MNNDLLEALVAYLEANQTIVGLFTGGIYNTTAAPGAVTPFLTLQATDSTPQGVIGFARWLDKVIVNFEVRHNTGDQAVQLVSQLRRALTTPGQTPVGWAGGQECGRWLAPGASGELEDGLGVDGSDVWVQRLPIGFTITRTA